VTDSEIESFIQAFEDCSLPRSEWTHTRHASSWPSGISGVMTGRGDEADPGRDSAV